MKSLKLLMKGAASPRVLLLVVMAIMVVACTGCASLTDAGHAEYTVTPSATGEGCSFSAKDGKEFASRSINMISAPTISGCQMIVQEGASSAFQGQAIAGKALSVLPSFAPVIIPGPASVIPQPK